MPHTLRRIAALTATSLVTLTALTTTAAPASAAGTADFGASFSESADPILEDGSVTYTVTVTNDGPDSGRLSEVEFQTSGAVSEVTTQTPGCVVEQLTEVNCGSELMKPGASRTYEYTADASGSGSILTAALLTVDSSTIDPDPSNNSVIESTTVEAAPQEADLAVGLEADAGPLLTSQITYDLTVDNVGPGDVSEATFVVQLPRRTTSVGLLPAECTYDSGTDEVTCSSGALAHGASYDATLRANLGLLSVGHLPATATRSQSSPADPEPGNDSAHANCTTLTSLLISCS